METVGLVNFKGTLTIKNFLVGVILLYLRIATKIMFLVGK